MNDDLKAYVDGELPPDAAERLQRALADDPALASEADALRALSFALRRLPEPEPVGQAATLAALRHRPAPLWRSWVPALAACGAVLFFATAIQRSPGRWITASFKSVRTESVSVTATMPLVRRDAFVRYVRGRGGQVRRDGDGLRAFYPPTIHGALKRRFLFPEDLPWPTDGLRIQLVP